jgi:NADH-quinone oxidoreductase subunit J
MNATLIYLLTGFSLISATAVIIARNPIHSVIFLIAVFVNVAGILLLMGVDFLAMIFVVVYVGAIAVLFLFVVMMLNIKLSDLEDGVFQYVPIGALIGILFLRETLFVLTDDLRPVLGEVDQRAIYTDWAATSDGLPNMDALGQVLYTHYLLYFLLAGAVLLVAMIGAIVLTMQQYKETKRQHIGEQLARNVDQAIFMAKR